MAWSTGRIHAVAKSLGPSEAASLDAASVPEKEIQWPNRIGAGENIPCRIHNSFQLDWRA